MSWAGFERSLTMTYRRSADALVKSGQSTMPGDVAWCWLRFAAHRHAYQYNAKAIKQKACHTFVRLCAFNLSTSPLTLQSRRSRDGFHPISNMNCVVTARLLVRGVDASDGNVVSPFEP
jgi:hypothetical protein